MAGQHRSTSRTYAGGIGMGTQPRTQPTAGGYVTGANLQPQQFRGISPGHASGNVKTGMNPLTYQGGSHRAGKYSVSM